MLTSIFAKSGCRNVNQNHLQNVYFLRIFKIAKDIKYVVQGEKNGERDGQGHMKVPSQTSPCTVKEKE